MVVDNTAEILGRTAERWVRRGVVGFLAVRIAGIVSNLWLFPSLKSGRTAVPADPKLSANPRTALLIPMRNERATVLRTLPGFLAAGFDEVIFLDDESTDESAEMVAGALRLVEPGRARLIRGVPRPGGWAGKTWACAQLAEATTADVLVFCDCDVSLAPGVAAALLRQMNRQSADVFSVFCRQQTGTWSERLLIPLITDMVLCFLPFGLLSRPVPAACAASGALLALDRAAYDRIGGFEAVRGELVEDLALARLCRRLGEKLGLALGGDLAQVRMYDSYRAVIAGMGRGLVPAVGHRRSLLALGWVWHVIAYTVPVLLLRRSIWWRVAAGLAIGERLILEAKTGGRDWAAAGFISMSPLAAGPVVFQALRRRQIWKGRTYGVTPAPVFLRPRPTPRVGKTAA